MILFVGLLEYYQCSYYSKLWPKPLAEGSGFSAKASAPAGVENPSSGRALQETKTKSEYPSPRIINPLLKWPLRKYQQSIRLFQLSYRGPKPK